MKTAVAQPETLSASLEDYIKGIYHISEAKQAARAKDIADRLQVNNSSVTGALRALAERGLVNYAPYDIITLTPKGRLVAEDVIRRHDALKDFFVKVLAVDPADAEVGACKMEHEIPPSILERFIEFVEFVEICPRGGIQWVKGFGYYCRRGMPHESCERCVAQCLDEIHQKAEIPLTHPHMTLKDLKPGQKARMTRIRGRGEIHKRLLEMGLTPGALVVMEKEAPLGDPIEIKVKGYHLSLRKDEAAMVSVEPLEG